MRGWSTAGHAAPLENGESLSTIPGKLILAGFVLALWLATHPYMGVVHDARLYLLQTLYSIDPARWQNDLFFKYGTQDSYSLFSNGYKFLVLSLGVSRTDPIALLVGDALWLAGLSALTHTILKRPIERIAAICGMIALGTSYGGLNIFHYSEPFVTPRLFAEAAVMGSLALAAQGRYIWMSGLTFLAFIIHPLMTIPGIGIVGVNALRHHRRAWIALGVVLLAGLICTGLSIEPFAKAKEFYDATWFQIAKARNGFAIISAWSAADYARMVATFLALGAFLTVANAREHRFVISLLVAAVVGCMMSFIGADLAHNVLITSLQLWRVMWIASLSSNAAIFLLLLRSGGTDRMALTVAAIFSFLPQFLFGLSLVAPFVVILCLLWVLRKRFPGNQVRSIVGCMILVLAAMSFAPTATALHLQIVFDGHIGRHLSGLALATIAILGLAWATQHSPGKWLVAVVIATLAGGIALVDQRTSWNRYVYESGPDGGLSKFLANSGATYWEGAGTVALWFKARKPSYYSCLQGSESTFFRSEALEWSKRKSVLQSINTEDFGSMACGLKADFGADGPDSRFQIAAVCEQLPDLDTIVLNQPVPGLPRQSWTAPAYQETRELVADNRLTRGHIVRISTFYRYDCASLRGQQKKSRTSGSKQ